MVQLLVSLLAVGIANLLFVGFQVAAFKVARFPVEQIGFGLPFLLECRVKGTKFMIGPVPLLSFVYSRAWMKAERGKRALTAIAPWLVIGCIPALLVGPARAFRLALSLWPRLIEGGFDRERAQAIIGGFWNLLGSDWMNATCVVILFMVAMSSMPIPGLAGGHVLLALLGIRPEDRPSKVLLGATLVLWGVLVVCWLFWARRFSFAELARFY